MKAKFSFLSQLLLIAFTTKKVDCDGISRWILPWVLIPNTLR